MSKTILIRICLVLVSIGLLSGCSVKSEIRKKEPKGENADTDRNILNVEQDIKDEYSMFHISYMDLDDTALASGILGENIDTRKIKKKTESYDDIENIYCEYEHKDRKFSWLCEVTDGKKRSVSFNFIKQEGKKLEIKDPDTFIRDILEKTGCRYSVSDGRIVAKGGDEVQLEYDYIYEGTELAGNRGISFDDEVLSRVEKPPYILLSMKGDAVRYVDFVRVPDKIKDVRKCKREEFISLEDVAAITDREAAYPSSVNIDKIEVIYTSLPQNDNFVFSPLYQVKFKNSGESDICNWKDILLIDVFTGRAYR